MKTALITGINGQDGSYLAEFLLNKNYKVFGTIKRNSVAENQTSRLDSVYNKVSIEYADVTDMASLCSIINKSKCDEIYHLAAQSHVHVSFKSPILTSNINALGTLNVLEAARLSSKDIRIYNAGSSEMFGNSVDADGFQRETTHMTPVSPYGCSKVFAYNICKNYRHSYGMFISNGILFNHESPRRGSNFVTSKVVKGAINIKRGKQQFLELGNLAASRDWGHAKDYVAAMYTMLQQECPDDFVVSTGISHTVEDLCSYVFSKLGMNYKSYIRISEVYSRPEELNFLKGDSSKARLLLKWKPTYTFETLLDEMINYWSER